MIPRLCTSLRAEFRLGQSRAQSLALQEWHRQARLAGGADPRIENADYARMLHRAQRGHLVRKPVANPAFLARASVEDFHGEPRVSVSQVGGFVNHRESASRNNPVQLITA
jgi:hypothetical protein